MRKKQLSLPSSITPHSPSRFAIDLEDAYNSEVALARRGCLKKLDGFRLKDKTGNVVWDLQAYDFLKQQAVADTVHPSLWLNGKANIEAGVFEVLAGKIYQVRGIDVANLTFVRSKTGWIVIDVTHQYRSGCLWPAYH